MSVGTSIEWTDASWSPLRARRKGDGKTGWHCEKVSAGCANCYAETFNGRGLPNGGTKLRYARDQREKVETYLDENMLTQPLRWRTPRKVFVCSMTDLFGDWVTDEQIDLVFAVMALAGDNRRWGVRGHTFQVLTKRAARMHEYLSGARKRIARAIQAVADENRELYCTKGDWPEQVTSSMSGSGASYFWPLPGVWLGVSVENQETADERIPLLLDTPAAMRFVSAEPLLDLIDLRFERELLTDVMDLNPQRSDRHRGRYPFALDGAHRTRRRHVVDWVIVGGESGPGARPCDVAWVRSIVEQCKAAEVACFAKQLGANVECANDQVSDWLDECGIALDDIGTGKSRHQGDPVRVRLRDRKGGDPSEWPADLRVREFPAGAGARA